MEILYPEEQLIPECMRRGISLRPLKIPLPSYEYIEYLWMGTFNLDWTRYILAIYSSTSRYSDILP